MLATADIFLFEDFRLDRQGEGLSRRNERGVFVPVPIGLRFSMFFAFLSSGPAISSRKRRLWRRCGGARSSRTLI